MSESLFYRTVQIRAEDVAETGEVKVIASTDAACDFGGYREILEHKPESVNFGACKTALLNHDRDQIVGGVSGITVSDGKCLAVMTISPDARTATGVKVIDLVRSGALAGVSIGYAYSDKDASYNEDTRTITARKWAMREISLTPTQADVAAHVVRSLPDSFKPAAAVAVAIETAATAATKKESRVSDDQKKSEPVIDAAHDEKIRAAAIEQSRELTTLARSHGLKPEDYLDPKLSRADALAKMLGDRAEMKETKVEQSLSRVSVTADDMDKKRDMFAGGMLWLGGSTGHDCQKDNPWRGRSVLDMVRAYAAIKGENPTNWARKDLAHYALGEVRNMSVGVRDANVTSSNFISFVMVNAMDKSVMKGFNDFESQTTYGLWTSTRYVADFKQVTGGALDSGNLVTTAENVAFPELAKNEGGYNATASLWGATVSLTFQALVNDDLGEFMAMIGRAGAIAQRTIDKEVYAQLSAATWTNNISSGFTLSTAGSIDAVYTAFVTKTGPAGEIVGNTPKYLLVAPQNRQAGENVCGISLPPGSTTMSSMKARGLELIVSPQLAASGLTTSTYYLAGDPAVVDTMKVIKLNGFDSPVIQEYDAGAVAARKWKIMMPFAAKPVSFTATPPGGSSTVFFPGLQQGII